MQIHLQNKVVKIHFFCKKTPKYLHMSKKSSTFAPALRKACLPSSVGRAIDS